MVSGEWSDWSWVPVVCGESLTDVFGDSRCECAVCRSLLLVGFDELRVVVSVCRGSGRVCRLILVVRRW